MSPSKRLSEETTFKLVEHRLDVNVEVFECFGCENIFTWAEDEPPKYCPFCGRKRLDA